MTENAATLAGNVEDTSAFRLPHSALLDNPIKVGMLAFLLSEVAFFSTLITTYVVFLRESKDGHPNPAEVFNGDWPLVLTATGCLLASSVAIHFAERAFSSSNRAGFLGWWSLTIALGATFLACTAKEWYELITRYGLTVARNMFGSSYFTLVGFHAAHVTVGLILLSIMLALGWRRKISPEHKTGIEVVSWYWHFVDVVWIFVFSLVYIIGR
ncbi:MAG TPA: heme-copper oxidase subunit III [Pirellulales bacterium]|jgi:cytochrome c oxidase subunit 3/cytochrome o ubiquinol oxidase subunit 3